MSHLLYRRQFLLTQQFVKSLPPGWISRTFEASKAHWNIYSHPDLEVTESVKGTCRLILLGYLLDPARVDSTNQEIIDHLIELDGFDPILEKSHQYNGRFILIYIDRDCFKLFGDATGFRECFYLVDNQRVHCGSTPDIINLFIGAHKTADQEVFSFFKSPDYVRNSYTWVGHDTIYEHLKKLPPNHLLHVNTGVIERFWPLKPIQKQSLDEVARQGVEFIRGSLISARNRKPVHLGVTAGWDTRVLLAASRDIKQDVFYYVNSSSELDEKDPDMVIPKILARKLGFQLHVLEIEPNVEDNVFRNAYFTNNFRANEALYPVFYHGYIHKYDDTYTVSGTLAEGSARKYYYSPFKTRKLNGARLAGIVRFGRNPYAIKQLDKWIEETRTLCVRNHVDLLDLYQIEHEGSNWSAHIATEQDIVRDEVRPFNSRYLIELFWSLDKKYRSLHHPVVYKRMIALSWKEAGGVRVNPSWRTKFNQFAGSVGIDHFLFKVKTRIKLLIGRY